MSPASRPPIGLKSLSIDNFRGIDRLDLDFRRPDGSLSGLVVLAGPNGCGKTAVLEAALIAVGGSKLAVGPRSKRALRRGASRFDIRACIQNSLLVELEMSASSEEPPPASDPTLPFWYFSSWRAPNRVGPVNVTVGKPGRRPAKTDPNRLLNVKQQLTNAAAAQNFPGAKPHQHRTYSRWMESINTAWATFYPERGDRFSVGLLDSDESETGGFEVYYEREGAPSLPVDDLSAGQLEIFLFLASLVINDDREGLVFIDEPELHLDPQWHAPILRALMRLQPNAQFIVATHSPAIYDAAMSYERHFLVPADDPRAEIWGMVNART